MPQPFASAFRDGITRDQLPQAGPFERCRAALLNHGWDGREETHPIMLDQSQRVREAASRLAVIPTRKLLVSFLDKIHENLVF